MAGVDRMIDYIEGARMEAEVAVVCMHGLQLRMCTVHLGCI